MATTTWMFSRNEIAALADVFVQASRSTDVPLTVELEVTDVGIDVILDSQYVLFKIGEII